MSSGTMSATIIPMVGRLRTSVRIWLTKTVLPCQCGECPSKSFVEAKTHHRTRCPFRIVSASSGRQLMRIGDGGRLGPPGEIGGRVPAVLLVYLHERCDQLAVHRSSRPESRFGSKRMIRGSSHRRALIGAALACQRFGE